MGKSASAKQEVTHYFMSVHYGIALELDGIKRITVGDKVAWAGNSTTLEAIQISQPGLFGGPSKEGGVGGLAYFLPGRPDQIMPNELAARFGKTNTTCPAFRGLSTLFFVGSAAKLMRPTTGQIIGGVLSGELATLATGGFYWSSNSPFIQAVKVVGYRAPKGLDPAKAWIGNDVNGAHIIYECLTSHEFGMDAPSTLINIQSFENSATQLVNENFGLSLMWTRQGKIEDFIGEIVDHTLGTVFVDPRDGLLNYKLLRDDYDINELREINPGNAKLVSFQRKLWGEIANEITVTWTNPATEQEETISVHDLGAIAANGGVVSDTRNFYAVRVAALAAELAVRELRTASAPLAMMEVIVDRSWWNVVHGEVVKFRWPGKGINRIIGRVIDVKYGKKGDMGIKLTIAEDVFSLIKPPEVGAPSTGWNGVDEDPAPMEFVKVFTLPAYFTARALGSAASSLVYPEVLPAVLTYQPGADTISYNLFSKQPQANGVLEWQDEGVKTILGRAKILTPLYDEAVTEVEGLPLLALSRGPMEGSFVVIGDGSDEGSEIAVLRKYEDGAWTIDRGVLDTIPRPWPLDTPVWFWPINAVISDDDDPRAVGEVVEFKLLTRTSRGQLAIADAPTATGTMTARPHAPLRPANVKVNGTGFGEVDGTGATEVAITWATRNRLFEDGLVTLWTAGPVTPEYLQETIITVFRQNGEKMFSVRGLWLETAYTFPIAWVQQEQKVFIRVSAEREGIASIQSYGLWLKNIPQVAEPSAPPADIVIGPPPPPDEPDEPPAPLPPPDPTPPPPPRPSGGGGPEPRNEWVREV